MKFVSNHQRNKKPLRGVGINDADYPVSPVVNGKRQNCPFYTTWKNMISRCYMEDWKRRPGIETPYIGCTVVKEWHKFSVFKEWMEKQDWKGNNLDKDLKVPGNKVYGPDTCVFIPKEINILISEGRYEKYKYGLKKGLTKDGNKFRARIKRYGKLYQIGNFDNENDAHNAWVVEKKKYVTEVAETCNPELKQLLLNWMEIEVK